MVWWHSFNKALNPSNIFKTSFSKSEAHTRVHFSRPCFTAKRKNAKPSLHKSQGIKIHPLLPILSVTNLLFVPCQKTCTSLLPSKSIALCSVTFTFGLLRLLKKCHWWVKQGESPYPGRHFETSRPSGVLSDESQSCTGTTHTNHNYHVGFTEAEHISAFL